MAKKKTKDLKQTWEDYYENDEDTAIKDKPFFELEINAIKKEVEKITKGKDKISILEIGCGTGFLAKELISGVLKDKQITYTGIDFSKRAIEIATKRDLPKTLFIDADFFSFFENSKKKFDLIISQRSIMALLKKEEQLKLLRTIHNRLSDNGSGLFSECLEESSEEINNYRKKLGIKPFEKVWHSRYLRTNEIEETFQHHKIMDFCSIYWLITRIIYPYFEEPKHNTKLAKVVSKFPDSGNYGLVKLIVVRK